MSNIQAMQVVSNRFDAGFGNDRHYERTVQLVFDRIFLRSLAWYRVAAEGIGVFVRSIASISYYVRKFW